MSSQTTANFLYLYKKRTNNINTQILISLMSVLRNQLVGQCVAAA